MVGSHCGKSELYREHCIVDSIFLHSLSSRSPSLDTLSYWSCANCESFGENKDQDRRQSTTLTRTDHENVAGKGS